MRAVLMSCAMRAIAAPRVLAPRAAARPALRQQALQTRAMASAPSDSRMNIYTSYNVYKGKGAVAFKVIKPTWAAVPSKSGINVVREGTLLLEFANAVGDKNYDWEAKKSFALSALECAEMVEALEARADKQFLHDPAKLSTNEGQVVKTLRVSPAPQGGSFFLNLSVTDKASGKAQFSTPLTAGEARLVRRLMEFAIPRLLGFDEVFAGPPVFKADEAGGDQPATGPF